MRFLNITESRGKQIDAYCKIITTVFVIVGGGVTMLSYLNGRKESLQNAAIEARKPVLQARLDACLKATSLAVTATSSRDSSEAKRPADEYQSLYWGTLFIVVDEKVGKAANAFASCLNEAECNPSRIKAVQYDLALACRGSIGDNWEIGVQLPPAPVTNLSVSFK